MPVTPFHFGPGLVLKAAAPRHVSLTMFIGVNVVIDLEPITWFLLTGDPVHGYLHTLAGATVLALLCAQWGGPACEQLLRWWNSKLSTAEVEWLSVVPEIRRRPALIGAVLGTWSHVLLDAIMHADVQPLWPVSAANEFRGAIDVGTLHLLCVFFGLLGAIRCLWLRLSSRDLPLKE